MGSMLVTTFLAVMFCGAIFCSTRAEPPEDKPPPNPVANLSPEKNSKKLTEHAVFGIAIGSCGLVFVVIVIAVGAARGLAYIHGQRGAKLVHGNIKSSNIFLNSKQYGFVSDFGLTTLVRPTLTQTAGYRAPEIRDTGKMAHASDVYSYGHLLLELLTGKSTAHDAGCSEGADLVRWVHSVVREEWTAEVFDVELLKYL